MPGLVPGIHGSWQYACRGPWVPTDLVRGLKAHGSSPATNEKCSLRLGLSTGACVKPSALYQGTMLPTRNINYRRGRTVAPTPLSATGRRNAGTRISIAMLATLVALYAGFEVLSLEQQLQRKPGFLALAHHRRTPAAVATQRYHIRNTIGAYAAIDHQRAKSPRHTNMNPEMAYLSVPCSLPQTLLSLPCKERKLRREWGSQAFDIARFLGDKRIAEGVEAEFSPCSQGAAGNFRQLPEGRG